MNYLDEQNFGPTDSLLEHMNVPEISFDMLAKLQDEQVRNQILFSQRVS